MTLHLERMQKFRESSDAGLKKRLGEIGLELMKAHGKKSQGIAFGKDWHPDFGELRKERAQILTVLQERRGK